MKFKGVRFKIAIISSNPSKSKHLETATVKIDGISLDLVGLSAAKGEIESEGKKEGGRRGREGGRRGREKEEEGGREGGQILDKGRECVTCLSEYIMITP